MTENPIADIKQPLEPTPPEGSAKSPAELLASQAEKGAPTDGLMWVSAAEFTEKLSALFSRVYSDFSHCRLGAAERGKITVELFFGEKSHEAPYTAVAGMSALTDDGKDSIGEFLLNDAGAFEMLVLGGKGAGDRFADVFSVAEENGEKLARVSRLDADKLASALYGRGDKRTEYAYRLSMKGSGTLEISRESRRIFCIGCGDY